MANVVRHVPRKTPWGSIVSVLLAIAYGVSPIDLIPDLLPLLGFVDDAFVVPAMLLLAFLQYRRATRVRPSNPGKP